MSFRSVVLDVDSTLCGIEGFDWLAGRRSGDVARKVAELTRQAMAGEIDLDTIYGMRLALIAPGRSDLVALGKEYIRTIAPGAHDAIEQMMRSGVDVLLVSGGLMPAIRVVADAAGVADAKVHAVDIQFDGSGNYSSFDSGSPLAGHLGKRDLIASLELMRPSLMVGDGATDAEVRPAVDAFAAFTGFARREPVVERADYIVSTFEELLTLVTK